MKSFYVHYMNKYPGAVIAYTETSLDVRLNNELKVALRVTGAGSLKDAGAELGASDVHDLSPLPKNARAFKLYQDGTVKLAEEGQTRVEAGKAIAVDGKVLSLEQYRAQPEKYLVNGEIVTVKEVAPETPAPGSEQNA